MFSQPRIIKMKFWIEYNREVKYVKKNFVRSILMFIY